MVNNTENKTEEQNVKVESKVEEKAGKVKTDRELMEEILNNQRKILKEIRYNRFAYGIVMMLIITYIYFEMKKFGDILGTLIEIFLPT